MSEHPETAREHEEEALRNRLWSHAIGIVNAKLEAGTYKGGRWLSEEPGSAFAVRWGTHNVILTAKHVVADASAAELRLYPRPSGRLDLADFERNGYIASLLGCQVIRCNWEDLAMITVQAETDMNVEFHDISGSWIDPVSHQPLWCFGFPTGTAETTIQKVGSLTHEKKELLQKVWGTVVVPIPADFRPSYEDPFDSDRHYLVDWRPAESDLTPHGFSGAAMCAISRAQAPIWKPDLLFAGVATHFYKSRGVERVIKASVVRQFFQETFGAIN